MILVWAGKWYGHYPREVMYSGSLGVLAGGGCFFVVLLYQMTTRHKVKAEEKLHGSARWARRADLDDAGFFGNNGVYIGGWVDEKRKLHYLRHEGPEHVLCLAPTRSGKGVGLVIPTLLSWPHSAVITDLKGELWALTSGWRKEHAANKVLRFEPASATSSVAFNPLDFIRLGTENEVGDAQNLATLIVDPDGKGLQDHWQKTSQSLLVGCILHVLYKAKHEGFVASLPAIDDMLADPVRGVEELWDEMTTYPHLGGQVHPLVAASGRDMLDRPEQEGGSVLSTAKSYLSLYRDPVVRRNVERSDFGIKDLMHHESAVSLYIVTQPNDKDRLKPLIRVVVNMIIRLLADKMDFENGRPVAHYKHRLLMMLDEFPALGKLDIVQESLAFVAGYGLKCYLIVQDIAQLNAAYGKDESISSNCHIRIAYAPNRTDTAQALSAMTGETTAVKEQITESGKRGSRMTNISRSYSEVKRNLLTPDECMRLPGPKKDAAGGIVEAGDMLIFSAGRPAAYGKQILYFNDPTFSARAAVKSPAVTDRLASKASATAAILSAAAAASAVPAFVMDEPKEDPTKDSVESESLTTDASQTSDMTLNPSEQEEAPHDTDASEGLSVFEELSPDSTAVGDLMEPDEPHWIDEDESTVEAEPRSEESESISATDQHDLADEEADADLDFFK
jgi:type IV secretion system protein VirD4